MCYSDDPVRDASFHDLEQDRWLKSRPRCKWCGQRIQDDDAFEINDELVCNDCVYDCRVSVD